MSHTAGCIELTGNTGRDDDNVGIIESGLATLIFGKVAGDFIQSTSVVSVSVTGIFGCAGYAYSDGGDVGKIGSDARGVDDIVEGELINVGGELQKKRERLCGISC